MPSKIERLLLLSVQEIFILYKVTSDKFRLKWRFLFEFMKLKFVFVSCKSQGLIFHFKETDAYSEFNEELTLQIWSILDSSTKIFLSDLGKTYCLNS